MICNNFVPNGKDIGPSSKSATNKRVVYFYTNHLKKLFLGSPRKKSLCTSFPGKGRKKGTHISFFEGIFVGKRGPKRAILGYKKSRFFLFLPLALIIRIRRFMSKFMGVSPPVLQVKKGRTWEHGPGTLRKLLSSCSFSREWPQYCRKVYWTKMVQDGPNDHFGQNDLIPNWI